MSLLSRQFRQVGSSVVEADSDFFNGRLRQNREPVLFTASLQDQALQNVGAQVGRMCQQIPESRAFLVNGGDLE